MLSTTTSGTVNATAGSGIDNQSTSQQNTVASTSISTSVTASLGASSICSKVKDEQFTNLSPESISNQTMSEEANGNSNKIVSNVSSGNGNSACNNKSTSGVNAESVPPSVCATPNMLRQNSSSSINSCLATSPNNGSDHSNCSNVSASLSQIVDSGTTGCDMLQEENKKKNQVKDEEGGNTPLISIDTNTNKSKGPLSVTIKDEPDDILSNLVNMKKEENLSPNLSPVGFGSIGCPPPSSHDRAVTPVKLELMPNSEKTSTTVVQNTDDIAGCNSLNSDTINESSITSINGVVSTGTNSGTGLIAGGMISNINAPSISGHFLGGTGGGALGNCLDYMQQQNHIFVFSTQLANKGAESVLNGQFQTIIAYHCTQPATKSFLEDFFLKNPMKMNKLQRQNSMGICNMPSVGGQAWMAAAGGSAPNMMPKILQQSQQKSSGPKSHFQQADNSSKASSLRNVIGVSNTFGESSESLSNENDLMCWETGSGNRSNPEDIPNESQTMKLLDSGVDSVVGSLSKCSDLSNESNIVSLQGVKVPDENLTPQQRQHREEQLAKIKKMNQFLFPENDNISNMPAGNQLGKHANDPLSGGIPPNLMINMPSGGSALVNSTLNSQMRQIQSNIMGQNAQKSEHMTGQLVDDVLLPGDVIGDIGSTMPCNNRQKGACGPVNLQCSPGAMNVNVANIVGNNLQCSATQSSNLMANSDLIVGFTNTGCGIIGSGNGSCDISKGSSSQDGLPQVGLPQTEWSKIQHQFFEERLKGNKVATRSQGMPGPVSGGPTPLLPMTGASVIANQSIRNTVQGPPPPYHPTQRSASVPIATQSPNPSSPNNLSLPSPRTVGTLGMPSSSPSMETISANTSTTNTSNTAAIPISALSSSKNCFQSDGGSPSNRHRNSGTGNVLSHMNSNPTTPLSHLSPKELDSLNQSSSTGDMKGTRPSPQRPRSPGNTGNHFTETSSLDPRFSASSPGLNFNTHIQNNTNTSINAYKGPSSNNGLERQNTGHGGSVQFARRSDNMPLNPNSSNRPPQNKITQNFDPISSLAQMSQQLTSCVSGVVSPAGGINMMGPSELNIEHGMLQSMEASGMDHINHPSVGTPSNSCHSISPLMNSMGQRMLNPKICGSNTGFNTTANGVIRDGPGSGSNFHGIMPPTARMMGRMPVNFGPNFNPNVQVKASTPNTIQYMPVRPQNNNSNVRMPPSLEFLQRYANPQIGAGGPPIGNDAGMMVSGGPMNLNSPSDQANKMTNNPNGMLVNAVSNSNGMHFFQNCNQLSALDDESSHEMGIGQSPLIRGIRPHAMRQHGLNPRLQAPSGNIVSRQQIQFQGNSDGLDCTDPTAVFNNTVRPCNSGGHGGPPLFSTSQQVQQKPQHLKAMPTAMCHNVSAGNVSLQANNPISTSVMLPGDMGQPVLGPNNNIMSCVGNNGPANAGPAGGGGNGNPNYKPFVGPSSNDLKYAQQYHSFQQQLYATNTRSQQQQAGINMNAIPPNLSPNPAFFVNK